MSILSRLMLLAGLPVDKVHSLAARGAQAVEQTVSSPRKKDGIPSPQQKASPQRGDHELQDFPFFSFLS